MTRSMLRAVTLISILLLGVQGGCLQGERARATGDRPRAIRWVLVEKSDEGLSPQGARPSLRSGYRERILVAEPIWLFQEDSSILIQVSLVSALPNQTVSAGEIVKVRIRIREPLPSAAYQVTAIPDSSQVTLLTPMPQTVAGSQELEIRFTRRHAGRGGISIWAERIMGNGSKGDRKDEPSHLHYKCRESGSSVFD